MSELHLFGLNCQTRSDHMYCIFLSGATWLGVVTLRGRLPHFDFLNQPHSSHNVQTMLLNPKSPYLKGNLDIICKGSFLSSNNPIHVVPCSLLLMQENWWERHQVCCSLEIPCKIGHQACKPASLQFTGSAHPIHHWSPSQSRQKMSREAWIKV